MKKQSLRQFSLSDTLYIPQGSEALLKTLPQRVKEPLAQKIREACATLARAGH